MTSEIISSLQRMCMLKAVKLVTYMVEDGKEVWVNTKEASAIQQWVTSQVRHTCISEKPMATVL